MPSQEEREKLQSECVLTVHYKGDCPTCLSEFRATFEIEKYEPVPPETFELECPVSFDCSKVELLREDYMSQWIKRIKRPK